MWAPKGWTSDLAQGGLARLSGTAAKPGVGSAPPFQVAGASSSRQGDGPYPYRLRSRSCFWLGPSAAAIGRCPETMWFAGERQGRTRSLYTCHDALGIPFAADYRRDHPCDCKRVLQIERSPTGSDDLNTRGHRQRAKLLADLAGSTEQEQPHPSRALSWRGRDGRWYRVRRAMVPTRRDSRGAISRSIADRTRRSSEATLPA
jgi:hypothetical protein